MYVSSCFLVQHLAFLQNFPCPDANARLHAYCRIKVLCKELRRLKQMQSLAGTICVFVCASRSRECVSCFVHGLVLVRGEGGERALVDPA